jgi:hypothetical protein
MRRLLAWAFVVLLVAGAVKAASMVRNPWSAHSVADELRDFPSCADKECGR